MTPKDSSDVTVAAVDIANKFAPRLDEIGVGLSALKTPIDDSAAASDGRAPESRVFALATLGAVLGSHIARGWF